MRSTVVGIGVAAREQPLAACDENSRGKAQNVRGDSSAYGLGLES